MRGGADSELLKFFRRCQHPLWKPARSFSGGEIKEYGQFDNERLSDLEWRMYALIMDHSASMQELKYVYTLDEALMLYDLLEMRQDQQRIEYERQSEKGGE